MALVSQWLVFSWFRNLPHRICISGLPYPNPVRLKVQSDAQHCYQTGSPDPKPNPLLTKPPSQKGYGVYTSNWIRRLGTRGKPAECFPILCGSATECIEWLVWAQGAKEWGFEILFSSGFTSLLAPGKGFKILMIIQKVIRTTALSQTFPIIKSYRLLFLQKNSWMAHNLA